MFQIQIQAVLSPEALHQDPDDCFRRSVLIPLAQVQPPPSQTFFLLVDSVDEASFATAGRPSCAGSGSSKTVADLLATSHHLLPPWLLLFITARRQSKHVAKAFSSYKRICIDDLRKSQVITVVYFHSQNFIVR